MYGLGFNLRIQIAQGRYYLQTLGRNVSIICILGSLGLGFSGLGAWGLGFWAAGSRLAAWASGLRLMLVWCVYPCRNNKYVKNVGPAPACNKDCIKCVIISLYIYILYLFIRSCSNDWV